MVESSDIKGTCHAPPITVPYQLWQVWGGTLLQHQGARCTGDQVCMLQLEMC